MRFSRELGVDSKTQPISVSPVSIFSFPIQPKIDWNNKFLCRFPLSGLAVAFPVVTLVFLLLQFFAFLVSPAYAATFTPAMAKRNAPGPFTAAPLVQGSALDGTQYDTLTSPKGGQNYFEVMSQNKNYIYDAYHEFIPLASEE